MKKTLRHSTYFLRCDEHLPKNRTKKMDQISIQILVLLDSVFFQGKNLTGEFSFLMGVQSCKKTGPAFPAVGSEPEAFCKKKGDLEVRYFFVRFWLVDWLTSRL